MSRLQIPPTFDRSAYGDLDRTAESARFLVDHVCGVLGLRDLGNTDLLDVGCGTKFSGAFLNDQLPIKMYVGVDVYREMIEFLQQEVTDERFEYHHLNVRNELYNPDAPPMNDATDLGVGDRTFDLIWLFSVFTHLHPTDFRIMLKVLRRYVRPDGHLVFTAFLQERTASGRGAFEEIASGIEAAIEAGNDLPPEFLEQLERGKEVVAPFVDMDPKHPLRYAMYSRDHAFELIDRTGWTVVELLEPNEFAQHQFVCAPTS